MKEHVLWRKITRIVMLLAERLDVSPERAMDIFYGTQTCRMLHDEQYGLYLQGDLYIVNDIIAELSENQ